MADDFRVMHGVLYPHVAEWLTGLTRDQLRELGGVVFLHQGKRVWKLPQRVKENG